MHFTLITLNLLYLLCTPALMLSIGQLMFQGLSASQLQKSDSKAEELCYSLRVSSGLVVYTSLLFLVFFLTSSLSIATVAATVPGVPLFWRANKEVVKRLLSLKPNGVLWGVVILTLGVTLFDAVDGLKTPWMNSYGDLPFHLGSITSFRLGQNSAPDYHVYSGLLFSYPFFINLWTAALWWAADLYRILSIIFVVQWCLLWSVVYAALNGRERPFLPWAVLCAGGSYALLGEWSWKFIGSGYPWTVALSTVWIPQRSALAGIALALTFFRYVYPFTAPDSAFPEKHKRKLILLGVISGLAVLYHVHFLVMFYCTVGASLLIGMLQSRSLKALFPGAYFFFGLLSMAIWLPWLVGKQGMLHFYAGWDGADTVFVGYIPWVADMLYQWGRDYWAWALLLYCTSKLPSARRGVAAIVLGFLVGQFVQLAIWEWDQIKVFLAFYCFTLTLWSLESERETLVSIVALIALLIPAVVEQVKLVTKGDDLVQLYSKQDLAQARAIREVTKPTDVLLNSPEHNHVAALTGRLQWYGYEGWLSSHSILYARRRNLIRISPEAVFKGCSELPTKSCPTVLVWNGSSRRYWRRQRPGRCFSQVGASPVFLFNESCTS